MKTVTQRERRDRQGMACGDGGATGAALAAQKTARRSILEGLSTTPLQVFVL